MRLLVSLIERDPRRAKVPPAKGAHVRVDKERDNVGEKT